MKNTGSAALVLTHTGDQTADYLCGVLGTLGRDVVRLDTDRLPNPFRPEYDCGEASLVLGDRRLQPGDVRAIWYRRPKPLALDLATTDSGEARLVEREWAEAVEGVLAHVPAPRWVNLPARNALASRKPEQLTRAGAFGLRVPPTLMTQDVNQLKLFWDKYSGELIVKPLRVGSVERTDPRDDSVIFTSRITSIDLDQADTLARCPTLFQHVVDKSLDIRVTVVDRHLVAVSLRATDGGSQRLDIRRNNMADVTYTVVEVPPDVRRSLLNLLDTYGLRYAAVDFVVDQAGDWIFLEINPNGQWAWLDLVGASYIAPLFDHAFFEADPD